MKTKTPIARLIAWLTLALVADNCVHAADTTSGGITGAIEGRVYNPATGEYLRNAEVRVQGTGILELTAADGRYRIANAPAGPATVIVSHTGFQPATVSVTVARGSAVTRDFELQTALQPGADEVIRLGRFTVSGEREGTAKAIMEQRNSLNIKNVVASDTFSIMTEGNIGEVLQYLPGIQIRYTDGEPANPLMRGMAAKYGALQVDGVRMSGGGTRASELTSYSAYATDTIEYSKTNSADMDADAPAGTINMRSKSAFQRKGRYFGWQAYTIISSADHSLGKSPGPEDKESYKTLPSVALDFSDVYLDGKLGVVLNLSENNSILTSGFLNPTYDTTPTAYNPTPIVLTQVIFGINPKFVKRRGGGINLEYNFNPNLTVALRGQLGWEDWRQPQRAISLVSSRASQAPTASATAMLANPTTNNATRFGIQGSHTNRTRLTYTFAPQFTYHKGPVSVDGSIAYTYLNSYTRNGRLDGDDPFFQANYQLFGVGFTATRAYAGDTNFNFQQTSGPDMYTLSNWRSTSPLNNLVRTQNEPTSKALIGQLNGKFTTSWTLPTFFKAGAKTQAGSFASVNRTHSWTYIGPQNNRLTAELPVSVAFQGVKPLDAGNIFERFFQYPDRTELGRLQKSNPEHFIPNPTNATSAANLFPHRLAREYIDSGYIMANTQIGRLTLQEGLRYEATKTQGRIYERGEQRTRTGSYDNFFLSASGRYRFQENLMMIGGFSQSIQRAPLSSLAAVATISDANMTGTIPNVNLKPERGDNYSVRVEKYFEPAGVFSAGLFMFRMKNYHAQRSAVPAEEIGLGSEYPFYLFTTQYNAASFSTRGFELEYRQQLSMLPGVLKGLGVFANWTQTQSSDPELDYAGAPKFGSGGISFQHRRLSASLSGTWASEHNQNPTVNYVRERTIISTNWSYQLTGRATIFLTGRNIFNDPLYKTLRAFPGVHNQTLIQGSVWSFGFKGQFLSVNPPSELFNVIIPLPTLPKLFRRYAMMTGGLLLAGPAWGAELYRAQGEMAGEPGPNSVILQSRLTASDTLNADRGVTGAPGVARFIVDQGTDGSGTIVTPWIEAVPEKDYIIRYYISGLIPDNGYRYRIEFGRDTSSTQKGPPRSFRTLPGARSTGALSFLLFNCMGWGQFMDGYGTRKPYDGPDKLLGYPALVKMQGYPDSHFVIGAGDLVYYDTPRENTARTLAEMRVKWQQQFALPRLVQLVGAMGSFWMKDDHDFRYDDADLAGPREPSAALGIRTFKEQMPVVPPEDFDRPTYRTVRAGAHVQLWFLEGRDYRSPNQMDDGPTKTIWGAGQKQWLQRTLRESDAKWKFIITPTPMVGPDMDRKRDNHTNSGGFRHEGTQFFAWLKETGLRNVVLFTGDRHWQYHSIHPTGVSEFSCGSLGRENAVGDPPRPGDAGSTDPQRLVKQLYVSSKQDGGFVRVRVDANAVLRVELIDQEGVVQYVHDSKPHS